MKLIRPFPVTDLSLVSSTVSATDPQATAGSYNPATTYAEGDIVQVDSPTFTFTASGAIMTATAHGWTDGYAVTLSSTGTLPGGLSTGTVYYLRQTSINRFKLSATKTGAPIITTSAGAGTHTATVSSHRIYESLVAGNTGNTPHKSPLQWQDNGATNRWAVFDGSVSSATERADSITYKIQTTGRIDSLAALNVDCQEITITARESGGGAIVYGPSTYPMTSSLSVTSYWAWFFEQIERKTDFVDTDFPPYLDLEIEVTLTNTGGTARCGAIVVGLAKTLGGTQYGASLGITDYSTKTTDSVGNWVVEEGNFSKRGAFTIFVDRVATDGVKALLEQYRATPAVYVGSELYDSTIIYGFYRDFSVAISYPSHSVCTIDVEGLT